MMYEFGFSIVGDAPDTGLWRLRTKDAYAKSASTVDPADLRTGSDTALSPWDYTRIVVADMEARFIAAKAGSDRKAFQLFHEAWKASVRKVNEKGSAEGPLIVGTNKGAFR